MLIRFSELDRDTGDVTMTAWSMPDGLVRVAEAARFLGLSRSKLYLMMDSGDLPYVKFGKCRRIPKGELTKLVDRHTVAGREEIKDALRPGN
jgi:excisionase family DNA binding protein